MKPQLKSPIRIAQARHQELQLIQCKVELTLLLPFPFVNCLICPFRIIFSYLLSFHQAINILNSDLVLQTLECTGAPNCCIKSRLKQEVPEIPRGANTSCLGFLLLVHLHPRDVDGDWGWYRGADRHCCNPTIVIGTQILRHSQPRSYNLKEK